MNRRSFLKKMLVTLMGAVGATAVAKEVNDASHAVKVVESLPLSESFTQSILSSKHMLDGDYDGDCINYIKKDGELLVTYEPRYPSLNTHYEKQRIDEKLFLDSMKAGDVESANMHRERIMTASRMRHHVQNI